jgi:hypothetical protein
MFVTLWTGPEHESETVDIMQANWNAQQRGCRECFVQRQLLKSVLGFFKDICLSRSLVSKEIIMHCCTNMDIPVKRHCDDLCVKTKVFAAN